MDSRSAASGRRHTREDQAVEIVVWRGPWDPGSSQIGRARVTEAREEEHDRRPERAGDQPEADHGEQADAHTVGCT